MHETEVDAKTLSEFLGLHPRQVLKLAEQGLIVRTGRGKFALTQSCANTVKHFREQLAGHKSADGKIDAMKSNALLKESQRRLVDLKYQQLAATLISMAELELVWADLVDWKLGSPRLQRTRHRGRMRPPSTSAALELGSQD